MKSTTLKQLPVLFERRRGGKTDAGRLPFRVRVGVTGHRALAEHQAVAARVREALDIIETGVLRHSSVTPVLFTAVSALAEGADRLVADVILEREHAQLEVVLPLAPAEFMKDFETEASRAEFEALLARATVVSLPERAEGRPQAYRTGGLRLVDRIDVLIAVWDHEPPKGIGGTAELVGYAADQAIPTFVVSTTDGKLEVPELPAETGPGRMHRFLDAIDAPFLSPHEPTSLEVLRTGFDHLDSFNREPLNARRFEAAVATERANFRDLPEQAGYSTGFADWALPFFARADTFAAYFQWAYTRLALTVYLLAGAAVTFAALQEIYWDAGHGWVEGEVGLMVVVAICVGLVRWRRPHRRWIDYRSLAENLRSAPFIAVLNVEDERQGSAFDVRASWVQRVFTDVWAQRPPSPTATNGAASSAVLSRFFDRAWVAGQIGFHRTRSVSFAAYHRMLGRIVNLLFLGTLIAAVLHAWVWHDRPILVVLAIALPAFGASLSGYRELRQFGMHAERYRRAGERLDQIRTRMLSADSAGRVRAEALNAYTVMVEENVDWFGVLEFQELEVVV